jgi:protein-disulfide isomerase
LALGPGHRDFYPDDRRGGRDSLVLRLKAVDGNGSTGAVGASDPISVADVPILGNPAASIGIVLFSDFECPFCGKFARETLPELKTQYLDTGRAFLAFRHLPLAIHTNAERAAEVAACAGASGRFWAAHERFFNPGFSLAGVDLTAAAADDTDVNAALLKGCWTAARASRSFR